MVVIGPYSIGWRAWSLVLMGSIVLLIVGTVSASNILLEDDFTGTDGDLPGP